MTRTSPAEVRGLFRRVVAAAEAAGVDASCWGVAECEGPTGRGWRLLASSDTPGVMSLPVDVIGGDGFLGRTAREAALSLSAMARAYETVPAREVMER